jgi:hypothetical protein
LILKDALSPMKFETQHKIKYLNILRLKPRNLVLLSAIFLLLAGCSFVELTPGADRIIFANDQDTCQKLAEFSGSVKTSTLFIGRTEKAISEELQILAQNEAFRTNANAIWPISEIDEGYQEFEILNCRY